MSEQLFISESTLRRMVNRINLALKPYHLRIRGLVRLTGEQQLIEKLMINLLLEKYISLEDAFTTEICQKSRQLFSKYIIENQLQERINKLGHRKHKQLLFFIATKLYQLEKEKQWDEKEHKKNLPVAINEKKNRSSYNSLKNHDMKLVESIFEQPFVHSILKLKKNKHLGDHHHRLIEMIDMLMDYLENSYQIACEERQALLDKIMNEDDYMEPFSFILYDKQHQFLKQIKNAEFIRNLVALMLVYWPQLLKKIEKKQQIRALIVMNSEEYASYVIEKLELYLGDRYRFVLNSTPQAVTEQFNIPIFGISIYPKSREIKNLMFFHQQIRSKSLNKISGKKTIKR